MGRPHGEERAAGASPAARYCDLHRRPDDAIHPVGGRVDHINIAVRVHATEVVMQMISRDDWLGQRGVARIAVVGPKCVADPVDGNVMMLVGADAISPSDMIANAFRPRQSCRSAC